MSTFAPSVSPVGSSKVAVVPAEEALPYVAVGPSPDLSVTVHKNTYKRVIVFIIVIFVLVAAILVVLILYNSYKNTRNSSIPNLSNLGSAPTSSGASIDSNRSTREELVKLLQPPVRNNYLSVGSPIDVNVTMYDKTDELTQRYQCQLLCDSDNHCSGYVWSQHKEFVKPTVQVGPRSKNVANTCTLLTGSIQLPIVDSASNSLSKGGSIHLKSPVVNTVGFHRNITFRNVVFLADSHYNIPSHYWLTESSIGYQRVARNIVHLLDFKPSLFAGNEEMVGVYSKQPITTENMVELLESGQAIYHYPENQFSLPVEWPPTLYVVYLAQEDVPPRIQA